MAKKFPYGFIFSSGINLVDGSGNYTSPEFSAPAFLNTVLYSMHSGLNEGTTYLLKNNVQKYILTLGVERDINIEPEDIVQLLIEDASPSNELYAYNIGFRYEKGVIGEELSESSASISESTSSQSSDSTFSLSSLSSSSLSSSSDST